MKKSKIKKGDIVQMMTGKDASKRGKVLRVFPNKRRLVVEGLNLAVKHVRPKRSGEKGQRIQFPTSVPLDNAALVCPQCSAPTRAGVEEVRGKKMRKCKKCQAVFL